MNLSVLFRSGNIFIIHTDNQTFIFCYSIRVRAYSVAGSKCPIQNYVMSCSASRFAGFRFVGEQYASWITFVFAADITVSLFLAAVSSASLADFCNPASAASRPAFLPTASVAAAAAFFPYLAPVAAIPVPGIMAAALKAALTLSPSARYIKALIQARLPRS
ncbi:hypothetical protein ABN448_11240 [Delftia acidovorans]|uniref:hypothetical protein n=1 Tax=Delftia acidovorans TaxID=80866 RepID=UPI0015D60697|nr:hypothetical protein [Delftia acidovorans]